MTADPAQRRPCAETVQSLRQARLRRAERSDSRLRALLDAAVTDAAGIALVAVGGYGRRELSPQSDLDVVLLHAPGRADVPEVAERVWYPLWDAGVRLDHSVRTLEEMEKASDTDIRAMLGLLDARHVAGDPGLTLQLRAELSARWRAGARTRVSALEEESRVRAERAGDLAHAAIPDLKESRGGLRDGTTLRALVASWLVDVPHAELERCRDELLVVRDALHLTTGRPGDRLLPEAAPDLADLVGLPDATSLQQWVRALGRRMAHLSTLTWHRVDHLDSTAPRTRARGSRPRTPALQPLTLGVARASGEVVLDGRVRPDRDPLLLLRAAAVAAEQRLLLAPSSATRLARYGVVPPEPWPRPARDLMIRLLGTGHALVPVWETLEEVGALDGVLPEWMSVRLLPSSSPVHRFTVDRHSVETCVHAGTLLRRVGRPDVLLTAALLHDIGKGRRGDHSEVGAAMAYQISLRWGFSADDASLVARLVRHHLLLPHAATRRDLDDPATAQVVVEAVSTTETLDLLAALTEADARATGPAAWTCWRARLVSRLVDRARVALEKAHGDVPPAVEPEAWPTVAPDSTVVETEPHPDGTVVQVGAPDRVGLLSGIAAALALAGLEIRSARVGSLDGVGWSRWLVADADVDARQVRQRLRAVLDGSLDPRSRLRPPAGERTPPVVSVQPAASASATVIEVRDLDWLGLVSVVCAAFAATGIDVRSAHLQSIGGQAVHVFYVCGVDGRVLSPGRASSVAHLVSAGLTSGAHV